MLTCVCVVQEVQSLLLNWKGPDLTTYGELVLEGTFKVHRAKNERTLFLFERMLLITKRRGEHYVYKTHISVRTTLFYKNLTYTPDTRTHETCGGVSDTHLQCTTKNY